MPPLSKEQALEKLRKAVEPLSVVVNPCAEPLLFASKATAIVEQRLQLLQRMRAYSELRELAETTQRRGWPSSEAVNAKCRASAPGLNVRQLEAHDRALNLRAREVSGAQAAFARYRVAVGH